MHRRWLLKRTNQEYVAYLSQAASISTATAQVLINRGIKTPEEVSSFLTQSVEAMSDPMVLGGMGPALDAIDEAMLKGTRVLVHGDYDADGLTAASMLVHALRRLGLEAAYLIPNRFRDGYGFNPPAVEKARSLGARLIITADCGISSFEAAGTAAESGIGVIITDHHEPVVESSTGKAVLPEALSVINPKVSNPESADLSGAGVVLKLIQALGLRHGGRVSHLDYLDLASLGTLADSVPLVGENRAIVKEGLRRIQEGTRPGIRALKEVSGLDGRRLTAGLLAFTLVPRINAAGRVSDASEVVELLLSETEDIARGIASSLDGKNAERQKIEETVLSEALEKLGQKEPGPAIVLSGEGWHEGVIGIVASRIVERYSRPTFVLSISGDTARGSARSIPGFDVHAGLARCGDLLLSFGGHTQAAGLRLDVSELAAFEKKIAEAVESDVEDFTPSLTIDAYIALGDVKQGLVKELGMLEPFGYGNPQPVLGTRGLEVENPRVVGKNHLKMRLRSRSASVDAIGFNMGDLCPMVERAPLVDAAYNATINEWEGTRSLQLNLKGIRQPARTD
jgi:single-stranded-DNA-specific exonuclease